jgi:hypothetical protein
MLTGTVTVVPAIQSEGIVTPFSSSVLSLSSRPAAALFKRPPSASTLAPRRMPPIVCVALP